MEHKGIFRVREGSEGACVPCAQRPYPHAVPPEQAGNSGSRRSGDSQESVAPSLHSSSWGSCSSLKSGRWKDTSLRRAPYMAQARGLRLSIQDAWFSHLILQLTPLFQSLPAGNSGTVTAASPGFAETSTPGLHSAPHFPNRPLLPSTVFFLSLGGPQGRESHPI